MTVGQAFTPCRLRLAWGEAPEPGTFLVTDGGSAYRVDEVRGRQLHVTRWPLAEVPEDADIVRWAWEKR